MKLLLGLLLIFSSLLLSAQYDTGILKGKVLDNESKENLAFAAVYLIQNDIELRGTLTDFDGHFSFENVPSGTYNLKIKLIGYLPLRYEGVIVKPDYTVSIPNIKLHSDLDLICDYPIYPSHPNLFSIDETSTGKVFLRHNIERLASF